MTVVDNSVAIDALLARLRLTWARRNTGIGHCRAVRRRLVIDLAFAQRVRIEFDD